MGNYKEDTDQNFGTILFIILFSLLAVTFSSKSENQKSALTVYSLKNEQVCTNISARFDAAVFNAVNLPDPSLNCLSSLQNRNLNLFSIQYKISGYNHRTTQNFINTQRTRLVIEPLFLRRFYYTLSLSGKKDLPVLS